MAEPVVAVVIVTYNRKQLLLACLAAVAAQARRPARVHLIDNASTDDTAAALQAAGWLSRDDVDYHRLTENCGGAGGFAAGLARALAQGAEWVWMMDDDALPQAQALATLLLAAADPRNLYGSTAVAGDRLAWAMTIRAPARRRIERVADLPALAETEFLPFLGLLLHRSLVAAIGLPEAGFFLAGDDVEYCLRAQRAGARFIMVAGSRIEHPAAVTYPLRLPGRTLYCLALPPWKRYYDTRNRVLIARRHFGLRLLTQTLPGIVLRVGAALLHEPRKRAQLWAALAGVIDGLGGRMGRRHQRWRIAQ